MISQSFVDIAEDIINLSARIDAIERARRIEIEEGAPIDCLNCNAKKSAKKNLKLRQGPRS